MQQKNLLTFFATSLLILLLWQQLAVVLFPRKKPPALPAPADGSASAQASWPFGHWTRPDQAILVSRLTVATPMVSGLQQAAQLATTATIATEAPPLSMPAPAVIAAKKPAAQKQITLGDDSFFLKAVLTNEGAGVRQLWLNEFQEASIYGLPVVQANKKPAPLTLITDDPKLPTPPANLLFHYPRVDETSNAVEALGHEMWELVEPVDPEEGVAVKRVAFRTTLTDLGIEITKIFTLEPGDYHLGLEVKVRNLRASDNEFRYQLAGAHGLPIEGLWYSGTFRNGVIAWNNSNGRIERQLDEAARVAQKSGGDAVQRAPGRILRYAGVAVQYFASVIAIDNDQDDQDFVQRGRITLESPYDPAAARQMGDKKPRPASLADCERDLRIDRPYLADITCRLITLPIKLEGGGEVSHKYVLYNGPSKVRLLHQLAGRKSVDAALVDRYEKTLGLRTLTDYHSQTGWLWMGKFASATGWSDLLIACTNLMHWLLGLLHMVVPNYGVCIILLTVMVRGVMFPISRKQALTSIKMQALAPEMKAINEKHADDPQAKTRAVWELYGRHGVNPMGGCLPLLMQMPIFLGLYYCLQESIQFRLAPFLWMGNLAAPDMLVRWGDGIPVISAPAELGGFFYLGPFFNILPVIAVSLMLVQQKLMTPPAMDEQQEMQQKMMKYMMVFMGLAFYKVAAGLCVYFIASSLWGLTERKLLPKAKPGEPPRPPSAAGADTRSAGRLTARGERNEEANGSKSKFSLWLGNLLDEARAQEKGYRKKGKGRGK
jgi:YidC/Oxa1 family membrane protein insertase